MLGKPGKSWEWKEIPEVQPDRDALFELQPDREYVAKIPLKERNSCFIGTIACICSAFPQCPFRGNPLVLNSCTDFVFQGGMEGCNNGVEVASGSSLTFDISGDGVSDFGFFIGSEVDNNIRIQITKIDKRGNSSIVESPVYPIHYNTFFQVSDIDGDGKTDFAFEENGALKISFSDGNNLGNPVDVGISIISSNDFKTRW